jgi:predicted AAA+ superfamily ATPase
MQLRRFWTMLAHSHSGLWNASKIAGSLDISAPTVRHYLDILHDTFIVRQLQPYHSNLKKRLIKSPKAYVRDTGLLHALLRIRDLDDLQGHPSLGSSWEGFVIEQVIGSVPATWQAYFFRTNAGAVVDLLLIYAKSRPVAVEIKYSLSPAVTRGFWNTYEDLGCKRGFVVYPGDESYPIGNNVFTLPVKELPKILEG